MHSLFGEEALDMGEHTKVSMWIIETERLGLRELKQSDYDDLYAMFNDPLVMRYYPSMRDAHQTQEWLDRMTEWYRKEGHGLWAVELKESKEFVGQCGLLVQTVDDAREVEIGYLLKAEHWHQGYATEAAVGCREYAFSVLHCPSVISLIRPINGPSRAVAERVGMKIDKTTMFRTFETLVYRIDAP